MSQKCPSSENAILMSRRITFQAGNEKTHLQFPLPRSLRKQYEYLSSIAASLPASFNIEESIRKDFLVPIYCNTFTPKQDVFVQVTE